MSNPFDPAYLSTPAYFGPIEWAFFVLQLAGAAAGIYLAFLRKDSTIVRRSLLQRFGYVLLVVGGIGVILGVLRLNLVGVFAQRYWFLLIGLIEVGLACYVAYYVRFVYPQQLARSHTTRGKTSQRQLAARITTAQNGAATDVSGSSSLQTHSAASSARTGRRDSRRERKRKRH